MSPKGFHVTGNASVPGVKPDEQGNVTGDRWYNREIRTLDPAAHRMQNNAPARDRQNAM